MRAAPSRQCAHALLGEVRRRNAHARDVLRSSERMQALDGRGRAQVSRLVLGVVGTHGLLDQVVASHLAKGARLEPKVRDALRLATYELLFLSTPAPVAVSQGVELVRMAQPRAAGLSNAVLHKVAAVDVPRRVRALDGLLAMPKDQDAVAEGRVPPRPCDSVEELALVSGYPAWLLSLVLEQRGPDAATQLACSALGPAPVWAVPNLARHTAEEGCRLLANAGTAPIAVPESDAFLLESPASLAPSGLVEAVDVVVCDLAAQHVPRMLAPQVGMRVLEVGQGRGTKSVLMQNESLKTGGLCTIAGVDSEPFKTKVASTRMQRASLADSVSCHTLDGRLLGNESQLPEELGGTFDRVLVDAPCSGTGTLRRHPEIAWRLSRSDVDELVELQLALLRAASRRVSGDGVLCYATCSILCEENEGVVRAFLGSRDGASFEMCGKPYQTLPSPNERDGHFCTRLIRRS